MDDNEVYPCFSYDMDDDDELSETVSSPATPLTPLTPASDQDTDRSGFSVSMDSGIGSPSPFVINNSSNHSIIDVRTLKSDLINKNNKKSVSQARTSGKTSEHGNKEKLRRERIKESCDQLRVLLPYIRGRKTDMASILEMCVDYLRIVNLCMPQDLHDQIVEILSKDPSLVPNKESSFVKGKQKKEAITTAPLSSGPLEELIEQTTRPLQKTISKEASLADVANYCDIMGSKRIQLQHNSPARVHDTSNRVNIRIEPTLAGHSEVSSYTGHARNLYSKTFTHHEEKTFAKVYSSSTYPDGYNAAQQMFNTFSNNKNGLLVHSPYRSPGFASDPNMYHYYPALVPSPSPPAQTHVYNPSTALVSPNSLLSAANYPSTTGTSETQGRDTNP